MKIVMWIVEHEFVSESKLEVVQRSCPSPSLNPNKKLHVIFRYVVFMPRTLYMGKSAS